MSEIEKQAGKGRFVGRCRVAKEGADVAKSARHEVEKRLGQSVVSQDKPIDHIKSSEELPFPDEQKQGQ